MSQDGGVEGDMREGEGDELEESEASLQEERREEKRERKTKTGSRRLQNIRALFDLSSSSRPDRLSK